MNDFALREEAKELLSLWYETRGDNALPPKTFIDPLKLRRWVGDISTVRLHEGEKRFYIAIHGANVARHLGPDFNRKYLEDVIPDSAKPAAFAPYDLSIETKLPSYSIQQQTLQNDLFKKLERMVLPCSGDDPDTADRFLVWVAPIRSDKPHSSSVYVPVEKIEVRYGQENARDASSDLFLLSKSGCPDESSVHHAM